MSFQDAGDSDSEEEQLRLAEFESILRENDPDFVTFEEDEVARDSPEWHQIHLATERIRVPEILFQVSSSPFKVKKFLMHFVLGSVH